ncbi:MAG: S9 family peptidase [Thermoplasmata archaeon]
MNALKVEDFFKLKFLSDLEVFEKQVYFVLTVPSKEKNDYESKIWILNNLREFTSGPRDNSPKVSPDGKYLAFLRKIDKKVNLMIMPLDGGEAVKLLQRDDISNIKWSRDGKKIYFISNESKEKEDDIKIIRNYPFYFNGKGFIHNKRPTLFVTYLGKKTKKITGNEFHVHDYDISPDGKIALIMSEEGQKIYWNNLFILDNEKLRKIPLEGSFSDPEFSPDGKYLAFVYSDNKESIFKHRHVYLLNISNEKLECINCNLDKNVGNSINSDSRMGIGRSIKWFKNDLYFLITDQDSSVIYSYNGKYKKIFQNNSSIDFFVPTDFGIYTISQKINLPQEIYLNENKITNFNKEFYNLPLPNEFKFKASDGEEIEGWFLKNDSSHPTILEIHGGPKTAYGKAFMFEFYILNSSGFNILFMNPRGSDGRNEKFALQIKEHFGERDYMDIMEGLEFAIKNFHINGEKLGVMGGSYGGFMTNWILGHTNIFKAAITERSISNQISFFGTSDIGPEFNGDQIGGSPIENMEHYWEKSPLKYVKNIKTPLLILHSDEDYRCPIEQAYQLFTFLKFYNKNVKLIIFPGENHDLSRSGKPNHRIKRLKLIKDWFIENLEKN